MARIVQKAYTKGFTLVELLVVIAIIALLLSVLVPSLAKARESAKKVVCQGNVRQQALACTLYMNDNGQNFPSLYVTGSDAAMNSAYTGHAWGGVLGTENAVTQQQRLLNAYVGKVSNVSLKSADKNLYVFRCPADNGAYGGEWADRKPTLWVTNGCSYFYNSNALNNDAVEGLWGKKSGRVKHPSAVLLAGDWGMTTYLLGNRPFQNVFWHNKKQLGWINTSFVDTHVQYLQMTPNKPNFQNGTGWTVLFDGPIYPRSTGWGG